MERDLPKTLFHITSEEAYDRIITEGIKPCIGARSLQVHELESQVYLCAKEDLPYWIILLKQPVTLAVDTSVLDIARLEQFQYTNQSEYVYSGEIPAVCISRVYPPKPTKEHMRSLCVGYMSFISMLTVRCAEYYCKHPKWLELGYLKKLFDSFFAVCNNLDYTTLTRAEKRHELSDAGQEGEYTFVDTYCMTDRRLYQQLLWYPVDSLSDSRKRLHDYIVETFGDCLDVNTGGWLV